MIDKVNNLLSRMKRVKTSGRDAWTCQCPAHDDKSPSLKIDLKNGRILIKCWTGCSTEDILGAVGMDFNDIFPDKPTHHRAKPGKPTLYATDALRILKKESMIITMCAIDIKNKKPIAEDDFNRVMLAMERINAAMEASDVQL